MLSARKVKRLEDGALDLGADAEDSVLSAGLGSMLSSYGFNANKAMRGNAHGRGARGVDALFGEEEEDLDLDLGADITLDLPPLPSSASASSYSASSSSSSSRGSSAPANASDARTIKLLTESLAKEKQCAEELKEFLDLSLQEVNALAARYIILWLISHHAKCHH